MRTVRGYTVRRLGDEYILVGEQEADFTHMVSLNSTAAYLWKAVENMDSFTKEDLCRLLAGEYDVDVETAARDAAAIARGWIDAGLAEEN